MHELHIDLECFSSADLARTGVYKYVQSDDFEILLFGYSVDGGDVTVIDLASGEKLPEAIIEALSDPGITKYAHNSSFERICLSRWLTLRGFPLHNEHYSIPEDHVRDYLDPSSWRCTMVWSAYLGLPLSLAGVGTVLGLEKQKLEEGKDLIRYFCKPCTPTAANGMRTRNLPTDAPDKWSVFKAYIKGTFFICGVGVEDFEDLPDDLIDRFTKQFYRPEAFIPTPRGFLVVNEA